MKKQVSMLAVTLLLFCLAGSGCGAGSAESGTKSAAMGNAKSETGFAVANAALPGSSTVSGAPADGVANAKTKESFSAKKERGEMQAKQYFSLETKVNDVISDPAFRGYGRLIFPVDRSIGNGLALKDVGDILTWYNDVQPERTVEIVNYLKAQALDGRKIFYDIYTEEEKRLDPRKQNTGLFFFRGKPGKPFAVLNAGGGFVYVGAMHDSFPHALELAKKGYNAFALIYRPGAQTACEDLARAIAFIRDHADGLQVDPSGYSLWGGSAGARMAAWLGSLGTQAFGEKPHPRPAAVIMQYTGLSEVFGNEPPTYNCVGTSDWIAPSHTMQRRIQAIRANGTPAEIEIFPGLPHGFGLGEGTVAEGWLDRAAQFWEKQRK